MPAPLSVMQRLGQPMPSGSPMQQLGGSPSSFGDWLQQPGVAELLIGIGTGISEGSAPGGGGIGRGLVRGFGYGTQLSNQAKRTAAYDKRQQLQDQQYQRQVEEQDRQRKQAELEKAQWEQFLSTRPPEEQKYARFDPQGYRKQISEQMFPDAPKPMSELAQIQSDIKAGLLSPEAGQAAIRKATYIAPQQGPAPRDSYRVLTPEEVAQSGLAPGTVATRGSNGKIDILQKPPGQESDNEPLIEVYDPNSPTGTSFKRRSEAAGAAGKPPSGGLAITGYDEQGRPLIQMGGVAKEKPLPADVVGRASAVSGGIEDAKAVQDYVMPGGQIDRTNIAKLNPPILSGALPGTDAGGPFARLDNAIDAIIRLRTGAGMPVSERADYVNRYTPGVTDTEDTVRTKLQLLQRDLEEAQKGFEAARNKPEAAAAPASAPAAPDKPPVRIQGDADFAQLPSGALFVGPDGKTRRKP